VTFVAIS